MTWDIVIVGAGPAGALAARETARRGLRVLLVDRAAFPRSKVCGCCLGGRALALLGEVGLGGLLADAGAVPLHRVRLAARGGQATLALPTGVALSRERFDLALVESAVAAGAQFLPRTTARLGPIEGSTRSVLLNEDHTERARLVLAADGLGGRLLGATDAAVGSRIGAGTLLPEAPADVPPGTVVMACGRSGYVGLVTLEDGRLDVAAALDRDAVRQYGGPGPLAEAIVEEAELPPVPGLAAAAWRGTPALTRRGAVAEERVLALGDAAGYVEPFTGEGIAWALTSAVDIAPLAEEAVRDWRPGLARRWEVRYNRLVGGRQYVCRAAARFLRSPGLVRTAFQALKRWPGLASPVLGYLNAPDR